MKFTSSAAAAAIVLASSVSAQSSSPLELLQYASRLLTTECRNTVVSLATTGSLAQCVQTQNLLPILMNNATSVIPNVNNYLTGLCAAPACTPQVIANATQTVQSACRVDLARFGVSNDTISTIMDAYDTAREVACLSTNDTELLYANMTMIMGPSGPMMVNITRPSPMNMTMPRPMNVTAPMANMTIPPVNVTGPLNTTGPLNMTGPVMGPASTNSSRNASVLCPIALLYKAQAYLGVQFTNVYIDSILLGANATAYQQILSIPTNGSILNDMVCNDCVAASLEVILGDYPQLEKLTFNLSAATVEQYTNSTLNVTSSRRANNTWSVSTLYDGFCMANITNNMTFPASINQTAYNTSSSTNGTMSILPVTRSTAAVSGMTTRAPGATLTSAIATASGLVTRASAIATASGAVTRGGVVSSIVSAAVPGAATSGGIVSSAVAAVPAAVTSAVIPAVAPTKRYVKWE